MAPALPKNDGKQMPMRGPRVFTLHGMRPPLAAGDVCGNGIGLKKVAKLFGKISDIKGCNEWVLPGFQLVNSAVCTLFVSNLGTWLKENGFWKK